MNLKIDRGLVFHNTLLNFLGRVAPLAISVSTLPRVLAMIGAERYGILSLVLIVIGYLTLLDFGLGAATTKFVAEALGRGEEKALPSIVWTAVAAQTALGLLGAVILWALTPGLAGGWFNIPEGLRGEARFALYLLGFVLPLMLVATSLNGVLAAAQRFDLVNLVSVPATAATSLVSFLGARAGFRLPGIIALLLVVRLMIAAAYLALCLRLFPIMRRPSGVSRASIKTLIGYGKWFTVGGLVVPMLLYLDRFLLGRYLTMSDVTYYTVPFEMMTRLWILPQSLVMTLFPAFSTLGAENLSRVGKLYVRSMKYMTLVSGPMILLFAAFGSDLLSLWLGPEFSAHASPVFHFLLYGSIFSMLAPIAASALQGVGRPDLPVKVYAAEVPFNAVVVWLLVSRGGVRGAAASYVLRAAVETLLFAAFAARAAGLSFASPKKPNVAALALAIACLWLLMALVPLPSSLTVRLGAYAAGTAVYVLLAWSLLLDQEDRAFIADELHARLATA